uniref:Uncharacterized protein n=1 Tax=Cryptomonas curvata TaxID=233186 RepID=A0A7S0N471_9CRYP|mmetsp:Transcript_60961/g.127783  ORF Transcript_60961/g.127783 Transcript_60961/m.127783 type:complete len:156 (+) Transcript_60961:67-534(+)
MSVDHLGMDDSQEITSTTESLVSGMFADLRFARSIGSRRKSLSRRKGGGSNDKLTSPQGQFQADHHNHYANAAQICFSSSLETASSYNFAQQQALSLIEIKSIRGEDARHLHQSDRDNKNDLLPNSGTAEFFEPMRRIQKEECYPWPAPKLFGTH